IRSVMPPIPIRARMSGLRRFDVKENSNPLSTTATVWEGRLGVNCPAQVPRSVRVPAMNESQPNVAEFTVSELSAALKRTVEDNFGYVRVRGEISGYKGPHGSGHVYFALKDQTAKIDGVIWKGVFGRMRIKPAE